MYTIFTAKSFFIKILIVLLLCGSTLSFIPMSAQAQVQTADRERLLLQLQSLIALVTQLQARLLDMQTSNGYILSATGQQTVLPGLETAVARVSFVQKENQVLQNMTISLQGMKGTEKPWQVFERVRVYDDGKKSHDIFVANEQHWKLVVTETGGTRYDLTLPNEYFSISPNTKERVIAYVGATKAVSSDWKMFIPSKGIILTDNLAKTTYLGGKDGSVTFKVAQGSLSDELSCEIAATQETYAYGEDVRLEWNSNNAISARFVNDMSGKEQISTIPTNLPANGSTVITAYAIGNPYTTLEVQGRDGTTARCKAVFRVVSKDQLGIGIVSNMQPSYGSYSITDAVPVSWSVSGVTDPTAEVCVGFYRRPIVGPNYGYGGECFSAKNGQMTYTWHPTRDISASMVGDYIVSVVLYTGNKSDSGGRKQSVFESKSTFSITGN